ncbi:MAG: HlyD family efflux transporter periplasmic adaptor subunit [Bacteroidaceae bacterium]|nr:HlyD family efflux transporter periplasmic adaptor subunit [Bacteroidaceae bacterium]
MALLLAIFWSSVVGSCSSGGDQDMPLFVVQRTAFEDMIVTEGTTEAQSSVNIPTPDDLEGTISFILENGTHVKAGDTVCIIDAPEAETEYDERKKRLESRLAELEKLVANQELERALLEANIRSSEAEAILAEYDSAQMQYMSPTARRIQELQLERAALSRSRYQRQLDAQDVMDKAEVMRLKSRIARDRRRLADAKKIVDSRVVLAPSDGIFVRGRVPWGDREEHVVGTVLHGRVLVGTLPDVSKMKVKLQIPEAEYKRISEGDSVEYSFDATPDNKGWGRIVKLATVGKERTVGSPVKVFDVEASVDSVRQPLAPGVSAICRIYMQRKPDVLVVPMVCIHQVDSQKKVVYVKKRFSFKEREVTLGLSSQKEAIVTEGLSEGEVITLLKPKKK